MGPVIGNIGNLQFVLTAVLGGLLSVTGVGGITPVSYTHLDVYKRQTSDMA